MVPTMKQENEEIHKENIVVKRRGHSRSLVLERMNIEFESMEDHRTIKNHVSRLNPPLPRQKYGSEKVKESLQKVKTESIPCTPKTSSSDTLYEQDMEMMKEKFAKLLLGEDMSGGGKGVSSALALSNAITNLAASVFGELRKLEPLAPESKARWKKEIDWMLFVTDFIVELVPTQVMSPGGVSMEVMTTKRRTDLQMNIPALRKLDAMLMDCLDNFKDQNEFYYVSKKDGEECEVRANRDDKWWVPSVKVPSGGLTELTKKWLLFQKDSVTQVLKASMAINAQIISQMDIPENYIETLPKNGRNTLGDAIYRGITDDHFDPEHLLSIADLSSEHKIVDLKSRIEASVVIWRRKMVSKDAKTPWGLAVSLEKRELFEERAATLLLIFKHRYPGISQSSLDISKIQFNQDVGLAVMESYSRILESLAHKVLTSIEDVLYAHSIAQNPSMDQSKRNPITEVALSSKKFPNAGEEVEKLNARKTPTSMPLTDFMRWVVGHGDAEVK